MSLATRLANPNLENRAAVGAFPAPWVPLLSVVGFAVLWQIRIGLWGDVSWLITANEKWLAGAHPYRDFFEMNPPASLMLYTPAVMIAQALSLRPELLVSTFGFVLTGAALALGFAIARGAGLLERCGVLSLVVIPFAFLALPGDAFMERDTMAAVFGLPFVVVAAARSAGQEIPAGRAIAAGLGVALMVCLKPPFALIALLPALPALRRFGAPIWLRRPEAYVAAAVFVLYTLVVALAFPDYARNILPAAVAVYLPIRETWVELLGNVGALAVMAFLICGIYAAGERLREPLVGAAGLAALGASLGFLIQGKGWLYQAYPALAFAASFAALALDDGRWSPRALALPALVAFAAFWGEAVGERWALSVMATTLAGAGLQGAFSLRAATRPLGAALLGASAALFCPGDIPDDAVSRALVKLGPHPTLAAVTESFGFAHPRARRLGARWVQSAPTLLVTAGARLLIDAHPGDEALRQRVQPFMDAEKAGLVADIVNAQPDALLVGPLGTRFHEAVWNDPDVVAARRNYRLAAENVAPDASGQLWVRADLAERLGGAK